MIGSRQLSSPAKRGRGTTRSVVEGASLFGAERMRAPDQTIANARRLRRDMSLPEVQLWDCLRGQKLDGLRFRRQHPIGPFVLDFFCASSRLCVEVDGSQHDHPGQIESDARRDRWLSKQGIRVLRVEASDVLDRHSVDGVLRMIAEAAKASPSSRETPPPPPSAVPLPRERGRISAASMTPAANADAEDRPRGARPL